MREQQHRGLDAATMNKRRQSGKRDSSTDSAADKRQQQTSERAVADKR
jgi:hypothetical protein